MSDPLITDLIDGPDSAELVRDQIAAILLLESGGQQLLAADANEDPALWDLRVFVERSNPWEEFQDAPDQADAVPLVNVSLDSVSYDAKASNTVERQKATGVYNIDCYGYGVSQDDGAAGHEPGDEKAVFEAQRAVRIVRNILMAGAYTYLGMRGTVWRRWPESIQIFKPQIESRPIQHVIAARFVLHVDFNEFSPQVAGNVIELIALTLKRQENGEVVFAADYPFDS